MNIKASTKALAGGRRRAEGRRTGSGRVRALLGLGTVAFLALGLGAQGTFAFWTDEATIQSGAFSSGTLDITLNGALAGAANNGGSTNFGALSLDNMVPGESKAAAFPVANAGSVGLTYTVNGTATGALAPGMRFSVFQGTASNGTANNLRTGSCSGTQITNNQTFSGSLTTVVASAQARILAPSASENICVVARLDAGADNSLQGKTMNASLVFSAKQVGAP